ncbi:MAG TPA: transcription-repair coupling factor, partial [Leptospiraceae bacterium]|nr:transcription-repair coupling factor [Leptospiraceae bacterium]
IGPDDLAASLVRLGYRPSGRTEVPGEFTRKAGIIDVFASNLPEPIRIDYFDTIIESIRKFDAESQIGGEKLINVEIGSAAETILSESQSKDLREKLKKSFKSEILPPWIDEEFGVINSRDCESLHEFLPLILEGKTLSELAGKKPLLIMADCDSVRARLDLFEREVRECFAAASSTHACVPCEKAYHFSPLDGFDVLEIEDSEFPGDCGIQRLEGVKGRIADIQKAVGKLVLEGQKVFITAPDRTQLDRIAGVFRSQTDYKTESVVDFQMDAKKRGLVSLVVSPLREGIRIPSLSTQILTDADLFGRGYKKKSYFKKRKSSPIESFLDLKEDDHVVHVNHGIGKFIGLERVSAAGRERDFLVIEYADKDRLFVPLDQISLIQRYSAPTDEPRLDSLGKASFKKIRERVAERTEQLAQELVKIYAARMKTPGYPFPADTIYQDEFEGAFEWEETPDQLAAIESVKADMEAPRPMDRLICGDVGYGKTEVAIRAAFKAVMAGKQVVFICPTTVLALQHFRTFSKRYAEYPIKVDWMSRFRTAKEVADVKRRATSGEVDVVIGTHSLLAGDVRFKNMGLLVIDEEQRFGVAHKEALKKMKVLVDVLTLSATPIPRTLHMSLAGIRDLSIIETPPRNRLPVMTHVMEDSDSQFKEAVTRELERGGQVFYLHNRIDTIERAAARVRSLIANVQVGILHGRMEDDEVEDILMDFVDNKYQVLVTTTIVENGIDIANANTLIVDDADHFGLSQLYQLRGRVGRSDRQAYAYFFFREKRALSETAMKRLNTILEYQELGSGFKVAMRDLEIRGAGNILGKEQSGDIMDVGFEMYIKLLEDAVARIRGEEHRIDVHTGINLNQDMYLPESYIPDTRQRIEFYKRFEAADSEEEIDEVLALMQDRFGEAPAEVTTFVATERIRVLGSLAGFETIYQEDSGRVQLKAGSRFRVPPTKLLEALQKRIGFQVQAGNPNVLYFEAKGDFFKAFVEALRGIAPPPVVVPEAPGPKNLRGVRS